MNEINYTEKDSKDIQQHLVYAAAVVANIRARLEKFYECYMDDSDLLGIWGNTPWLTSSGNLHDRIRNLAREMECDVSWEKKNEAHFTRQIPLIQVVGGK